MRTYIKDIDGKIKAAKQELSDITSAMDRLAPQLKTAPMREREWLEEFKQKDAKL